MLLLCYIMSFVSESSMFFSMSHNYVTYDCDIYYTSIVLCDFVAVTCNITLHPLPKSKIKKK